MEQALSGSTTWKLSAFAPKPVVQAGLLAHDRIDDWDPELVIAGREVAEDRPDDWVLEGWYPRKPGKIERAALAGLFEGRAPRITVEELPPEDWVTLSQHNAPPIRAGRFHVHTPDYPADPDLIDFIIPASQAFGTGQHKTTAGCLEMLGAMKASGVVARNIADIGTGTGLLGFAALALWPRATCTLTDIDPVCTGVVEENARLNGVAMGPKAGAAVSAAASARALRSADRQYPRRPPRQPRARFRPRRAAGGQPAARRAAGGRAGSGGQAGCYPRGLPHGRKAPARGLGDPVVAAAKDTLTRSPPACGRG